MTPRNFSAGNRSTFPGSLPTSRRTPSPRRKRKPSIAFLRFVWLIWTIIAGGSIAGWVATDLPIVGPLVQRMVAHRSAPGIAGRVNAVDRAGTRPRRPDESPDPSEAGSHVRPVTNTRPTASGSIEKPAEAIRIASYNIQVFGSSKLAKPGVVDVLVQIVRHFDIVAIQEVRSKDDAILPTFVAALNADGSRYDFVISPRLGRTVSTEQYAFVFDTDRIEMDPTSPGTLLDPQDLLHREPFVARFRARTTRAGVPFSFWLVNTHTDPDEVASEIDALADVFQVMQTARSNEDDVILLGDLNASDRQLGRLGQVPGITWVVSGITTNTRRTKLYDNLLFDRFATTEFTGRWGVVDVQAVFGLTLEQALEVSDHFPVWAEFHVWESLPGNNTAGLPDRVRQ